MLRAAKGPVPIELEVPQVGDQERDRRVNVVPAHVEIGEGQVKENAVLVRTHLLAYDRDEKVDEDTGGANEGEPEEQNPVMPVAYEHVVLQAFHNR
jgi:hypothetical protein